MSSQIEEIKSRLDVADIIGEYLTIKPAGGQSFKAICPFHNEKTPSFYISRDKQIWHCFGCSLGGDIFEFIKRIDGVEFPEALRILAKKAGVVLTREDVPASNERTKILALCETAARFFEKKLTENADVLKYLKVNRGLSDEIIKRFRFGYAPDSWNTLTDALKKIGFFDKEIIEAGMGIKGNRGVYDRFRGRIMLPIANHHGQIVGFTGRIADFLPLKEKETGGKYVNTPETEMYHKRLILYGLDQAKVDLRKKQFGFIVEGNMDVVGLHQAGFLNTVCAGGTALTVDQLALLGRYATKWILAFDPDSAGEEATKRAFRDCLKTDLEFLALPLPAGKDPDEAVKENPELFNNALNQAMPMMEYFFKIAQDKFSPKTLDGKKGITKILLPVIKDIANPVDRSHFMNQLSVLVGVDVKSLQEAMDKIKALPTQSNQINKHLLANISLKNPISRNEKIAKEFIGLLLGQPAFIKLAETRVVPENFNNQALVRLYKEIVLYYNIDNKENKLDNNFFDQFNAILQKNHPELTPIASEAFLCFEKEFGEQNDGQLEKAFLERIQILLSDNTKRQIKLMRDKISRAEIAKDDNQIKILVQEFQRLTQELNDLDKNK